MKAAYLQEKQKIVVRDDRPLPSPSADQALIKIEYCGVCGSDVHFYREGKVGDVPAPKDFILGHEVAGTVVTVGENVKHLIPGDRVALEPGYPCGKCQFCKTGKYNLCPDVQFFADPPVAGALQEYVVHPASMCFKLPDNVSTEEGALVEPLSVGMHAASQASVTLGDRVLILGGGCIGLVTMLAAKARGASFLVVVDLFQKRLNMAQKLGATHVIDASCEDVGKRVKEIFGSLGADIVFETAGSTSTIAQTPHYVKPGGTICLVGMASESMVSYNFNQIMMKEVTIKSVFRYRNLYPSAIDAIASGAINVKQLVTHHFTFDQTDLAFHTAVTNAKNEIKEIIQF